MRRALWAAPALAFSLLLHIGAIIAMALVTFAALDRNDELVITARSLDVEPEAVEEFQDVEIAELKATEVDEVVFDERLHEVPEIKVEQPHVTAPTVPNSVPAQTGPRSTDVASTRLTEALRLNESRKPQAAVTFYGAKGKGTQIAFVVDNSGSMRGGKMLTTLDQLYQSVQALTARQEFYVAFFSDTAYPMFYPDSVHEFVPATRPNKDRLRVWLRSIELCKGGALGEAMELVLGLEPDVVFLLTDGMSIGREELDQLTGTDRRRCVIHTLGMGAGPPGARNLLLIAQANGGTFLPVAPHPAAVQLSKTVTLKYHNRPGTIWGRWVKP